MELRPGYKQTEVGAIPEDWEVLSVHQIGQIKTGPFGTLLKASEYSGNNGVPLISVGEVGDGRFRVTVHTPRVPERVVRRLPQYLLRTGDIVFGRKGAVDRSALVSQSENGWFLGSDGISIRPLPSCHPPYLAAQLRSYAVKSWLVQNAIGTTMASLNQGILSRVQLPCAPLPEQRAIAAALSDVDALLGGMDRLIAKKRDLKQAAMQQLLTGQTRLPGFHGEWDEVPLGALGAWKGGMTPSMQNPSFWEGGDFPWISSGDVKVSRLRDTDQHVTAHAVRHGAAVVVPANSIVLVTRSGILRKYLPVALTLTPMAINQDIKALIPNETVSADFLLHALIASGHEILGKCLKAGTTVESVEFPWLKAFCIPLPPRNEQSAIAAILSDMDSELSALEARRDKTRLLKQGMMQELLTGRTRLV